MKLLRLFAMLACFGLATAAVTGCKKEETAGDKLDKAIEEVEDAGEEAGDAMEDAAEETGDAIEDATD